MINFHFVRQSPVLSLRWADADRGIMLQSVCEHVHTGGQTVNSQLQTWIWQACISLHHCDMGMSKEKTQVKLGTAFADHPNLIPISRVCWAKIVPSTGDNQWNCLKKTVGNMQHLKFILTYPLMIFSCPKRWLQKLYYARMLSVVLRIPASNFTFKRHLLAIQTQPWHLG